MPHINVTNHKERTKNMEVLIQRLPSAGCWRKLSGVFGFNTDEKWLEMYVVDPDQPLKKEGGIRWLTSNRSLVKARLYIDFDIINKTTREILYSVRQ